VSPDREGERVLEAKSAEDPNFGLPLRVLGRNFRVVFEEAWGSQSRTEEEGCSWEERSLEGSSEEDCSWQGLLETECFELEDLLKRGCPVLVEGR